MSSVVIPPTLTSQGAIPTPPATLNSNLIALVAAEVPDYTANLPGTLIEDLSSTCTMALVVQDQARVDQINNLTPLAANPYLLNQLGLMFGVPQGQSSNTSVYVVFSGPAGYLIPAGFIVSDGTYQYVVQDGGIIGTTGQTASLFAVANQSGSWAVAANTVTILVTSVPTGYTLTVTNPSTGVAGGNPQSVQSYRAQVTQSFSNTVQGVATYIKSLLMAVPGVNSRLVSVLQVTGGWEVICAGGDPYQMAGAIYQGAGDITRIIGSTTTANNITVTILDGEDAYNITFVNPPAQTVAMTVTWNTTLANFTSSALVNQLASSALVNYINSIQVGQPLNELEMTEVFQNAISSVLDSTDLTTLEFTVYLNGSTSPTSPTAGTSIIPSPVLEGYWTAAQNAITVEQG